MCLDNGKNNIKNVSPQFQLHVNFHFLAYPHIQVKNEKLSDLGVIYVKSFVWDHWKTIRNSFLEIFKIDQGAAQKPCKFCPFLSVFWPKLPQLSIFFKTDFGVYLSHYLQRIPKNPLNKILKIEGVTNKTLSKRGKIYKIFGP